MNQILMIDDDRELRYADSFPLSDNQDEGICRTADCRLRGQPDQCGSVKFKDSGLLSMVRILSASLGTPERFRLPQRNIPGNHFAPGPGGNRGKFGQISQGRGEMNAKT